jgi:hypothetical protein
MPKEQKVARRFTLLGLTSVAIVATTLVSWPGGRAAEAVGPVQITACTTITEPGSYIVVNNITPSAPGDCLIVAANFVTIDLGGFLIKGNVVSPTGPVGGGITTDSKGHTGIAIRNGTITAFDHGITLNAEGVHIEGVHTRRNKQNGIRVSSNVNGGAIIKDCIATGNGATGILVVSAAAVITGNIANDNFDGVEVGLGPFPSKSGSTVIGNSANGNFHGIIAWPGTMLANNNATFNGIGMRVDCPSLVIGNTLLNEQNLQLLGSGCTTVHNSGAP